jgi:hypothetical protein
MPSVANNHGPDWYVSQVRRRWKSSATATIEACRLLWVAKGEIGEQYPSLVRDVLGISLSTDTKLREIGKYAERLSKLATTPTGLPSGWGTLYYVALIVRDRLTDDAKRAKLFHATVERSELEAFWRQNTKSPTKSDTEPEPSSVDFLTIAIGTGLKDEVKVRLLTDIYKLRGNYGTATEIRHADGAKDFIQTLAAALRDDFRKEYDAEMTRLRPSKLSAKEHRDVIDPNFQFTKLQHNDRVRKKHAELDDQIKKLSKLKRRTAKQKEVLADLRADRASHKLKKLPYDPTDQISIEHPDNPFSVNPRKGEPWTVERFIEHLKANNILLPADGIRERADYSRVWCLEQGINIIEGSPADKVACLKTLESTIRGKASALAQGNLSKADDAEYVKGRLQEAFLWE